MNIKKSIISDLKRQKGAVHIVLIGTKPEVIKQAPLILELKKRGHYTLVVHSGQHKDFNLSGGMEKEFGIEPDINLDVGGRLYEQQAQIIERFGSLLYELKQYNKKIIPYVCADTTTALAAGIASFANLISTAHVEAGLRTMSPAKELILSLLDSKTNLKSYFKKSMDKKLWEKGSYEPYPEQFDTRAAGPSAGIHLAPVELNRESLINEGYDPKRIFVTGNLVSDALGIIETKAKNSNIFEKFPTINKDNLIRFCIHRRENVTSLQRFLSIYEAMEEIVKKGYPSILISLRATEKAFEEYGLKQRVMDLAKKYPHFVYTPVLPYYTDTIAIMKKCTLVATDSGSIQEETNLLGIPGIVLRFNTDRPESIFSGSNVIAPPMTKKVVVKIIESVMEDKILREKMKKSPKLYGNNVASKMVGIMEKATKDGSHFNIFEFMEHERLGLTKKPFWKHQKIEW
jgi:UDP-N-acetylglucosamine 2-epimerase (non-hydrolysing)